MKTLFSKIMKISTILTIALVATAMRCGTPGKSVEGLGPVDVTKTRILIDKSDYRLSVYEGQKLLRAYPVVLGEDPVNDKRQEGDKRTPEGTFHIRDMYDHDRWDKFIWIDYPNEDSWAKFNARKQRGEIPASATIGGEIGIHGVPEGRDDLVRQGVNWTWGCISLTRADVEQVYALVRVGTEVKIQR